MKIINNLNNINHTLNKLINNDEYTSIGYIPTLDVITAADIVAIKKAKKLLDIIVIHNISNNPYSEFSLKTIVQLEPNLTIDLIEEEPNDLNLSLYIEQINSFAFIKAILSILPSSIFISQDSFLPFKAVNIFNENFPNMFSLHNVSTPESLKSFMELEVINSLKQIKKNNQPYCAESLSKLVPDLSIQDFQKYENSQGLFINVLAKDTQTGLESSITFLCRK